MFADNCEVGNVAATENFRGIEGAREFLTNYRDTFGVVCSVFRNQIVSDGRIALEWMTEGKSKNGKKIRYDGVSTLETEGEKLTRFYAYFDLSNLRHQITTDGDITKRIGDTTPKTTRDIEQ